MRKRLLNNWGLKLISLVLAFFLWFLVIQIGDPKDDRDMGNITVKLINTDLLDKENKVYEVLEDTDRVRVTVYAPKSVFTQLRSSDITAEADVSKLTELNTVPIEFSTTAANVVSIRGSHDVVKLNIEDKASKYVPLNYSTEGTPAEGYAVTTITPDQNRIEVSGPKSVVEQVKYAGVQIDVSDASSNLIANVDIHLYNVLGEEVVHNKLSKNVNYVRMSVEILAVKEVPVNLTVSGTPEKGYMISGDAVSDPESVSIAGTSGVLTRVSGITIPAEALDVTGATEDVSVSLDLKEYLPEGVKLADSSFGGKITVSIPVEAAAEKIVDVDAEDISVVNVPEGYKAEILESSESSYRVEFVGLKDDINAIRQGNLNGLVDVEAWMEKEGMEKIRTGNYTIPVTFTVGDSVTVRNTIAVKVGIKEKEQ